MRKTGHHMQFVNKHSGIISTSYPGFSLCDRGLKRILAKAAVHYVISCIFPRGFLNYQEEPVRRLLFCLFIEIAHSVDRYRNIYAMKCAQLYKINEDYRKLCSYEMLLNDNCAVRVETGDWGEFKMA
jgi:hypothetical protein